MSMRTKCSNEFKDAGCIARVCSSSDVCLALIGKAKCYEFDKFSQEHPESAACIVDHAKAVYELGG